MQQHATETTDWQRLAYKVSAVNAALVFAFILLTVASSQELTTTREWGLVFLCACLPVLLAFPMKDSMVWERARYPLTCCAAVALVLAPVGMVLTAFG